MKSPNFEKKYETLLFSGVAECYLYMSEEYLEKGGLENYKKALSICLEYVDKLLKMDGNEKTCIFFFLLFIIFLIINYLFFIFYIFFGFFLIFNHFRLYFLQILFPFVVCTIII